MSQIVITILLIIMAVASGLILILVIASTVVLFWIKVPYAPIARTRVKQVIDLLELKPGQKFYELGCGDGRFVIEATRQGAAAVGFEISPWVFVRAKIFNFLAGSKGKILFKNFYNVNLADADAVFCFLVDKVMPKVENKLMAELKPGAKIISYGFRLPNWKPTEVVYLDPNNTKASKAFIYIK